MSGAGPTAVVFTTDPLSRLDATFLDSRTRIPLHMHCVLAQSLFATRLFNNDGTVFFCVHADRDAAPDAHRVAEGIQAELGALGLVAERAAAVAAGRGRPRARCRRSAAYVVLRTACVGAGG